MREILKESENIIPSCEEHGEEYNWKGMAPPLSERENCSYMVNPAIHRHALTKVGAIFYTFSR